ncbi:MAG TPA: glycosyltransferase family 4 protein [Micromonosporaceae bacterium]|nr:glycosyltransferase family 4 protein [Micromonosporaceae bacterium]
MIRSLYVTEYWPWPSTSGGRLRAAATVEALAALGPVDVVHLERGWTTPVPNQSSPLVAASATFGDAPPAPARPEEADYPPQPARNCRIYGERLRRWVREHEYDVLWCNRLNTWAPLRAAADVPIVVDIDDLQDRLAAQRRAHTGDDAEAARATQWARLQATAIREVDWLVVCSELDRDRLGRPANSSVVPNVYLGETNVGPLVSDDPSPRILLPGLFVWQPNIDAARRLVREILPLVRREYPAAQVWLAGLHTGQLDDLAQDGVRIFGPVPDMRPLVRAADVVAVPLRLGSGTRLKILESFALGTPVVSTSLGAEGLDAANGRHLRVADDSADFAGAVLSLLRDPAAARQLAANARELVGRRYDRETLVGAARAAVAGARSRYTRPTDVGSW